MIDLLLCTVLLVIIACSLPKAGEGGFEINLGSNNSDILSQNCSFWSQEGIKGIPAHPQVAVLNLLPVSPAQAPPSICSWAPHAGEMKEIIPGIPASQGSSSCCHSCHQLTLSGRLRTGKNDLALKMKRLLSPELLCVSPSHTHSSAHGSERMQNTALQIFP